MSNERFAITGIIYSSRYVSPTLVKVGGIYSPSSALNPATSFVMVAEITPDTGGADEYIVHFVERGEIRRNSMYVFVNNYPVQINL